MANSVRPAGLIFFETTNDLDIFLSEMTSALNYSKNTNIKNKNVTSNKQLYKFYPNEKIEVTRTFESLIVKAHPPGWKNNLIYDGEVYTTHVHNTSYYKLTIISDLKRNLIYYEINGQIGVWDKLISKNNCLKFCKKTRKDLANEVNKFKTDNPKINVIERDFFEIIFRIMNSLTYQNISEKLCGNLKINLSVISTEFFKNITLFDRMLAEKSIPDGFKLISYDQNTCTEVHKIKSELTRNSIKKIVQSEGTYNKLVEAGDKNKYILLDRQQYETYGIEVADIYDKTNNLLFHNKKIKNLSDVRNLSFQIMNSALLLKSGTIDEYLKTKEITSGYKYVFGIIYDKNPQSFTISMKLTMGMCCNVLDTLGLDYYIDVIEIIKNN